MRQKLDSIRLLHSDETGRDFVDTDFTRLTVCDSAITRCTFTRCTFFGVEAANAKIEECTFIDCIITNVSFKDVALKNVMFKECKAAKLTLNISAGSLACFVETS